MVKVMKIGIISDTHGSAEAWQKAYKDFFSNVDLILHAGDHLYHGPRNKLAVDYSPKDLAEKINTCDTTILSVRGNCDSDVDAGVLDIPLVSPYLFTYIEGFRFVVTHGDVTETDEEKLQLAQKLHADIFISGHTHVAGIKKENGCVFINPGSPSLSKRSDGRQTIAVLDLIEKYVRIYDLYTKEVIEEVEI